jgi:exodeoxyribonuclease-3
MRIATWNVNSLKARLDRVEHWLGARQPETLCIQETKLTDDSFPALTFQALGYETVHHGQGQWNGVAILSRVGIEDVRAGFDDDDDPDAEARLLWATCGGVRIGTVYVPNGREVGHEHYEYKLRFLDRLRGQLERHEDRNAPLVLCGDFNIAPEDRDVWDPEAFVGATHVSEPERERFRALQEWGLVDSFRQLDHDEGRFTWWDYRGGNFHKKMGMRIDHLLVSPALADRLTAVEIDREERKPKGNPAGGAPSDHAPLIATFD